MPQRWGMSIPFDTVPLSEHAPWLSELAGLGYTDVWSAEAGGTDGFTPLALAAAWEPRLRLGTAIVPVYLRGPGLLANTAAAMAEAAPHRFALGLGTSSPVIIEQWNGLSFDRPYARARDTIRFLREAFKGEKVTRDFETFSVRGVRLGRPLPADLAPPLLLAGLRPGMLRLAGREADGAVLNWLSADDVPRVIGEVKAGADQAGRPDPEIVARIFVCPTADAETARRTARMAIAAYLTVPAYAAFHEWLGRAEALRGLWDNWAAGDRRAALTAIPDAVVDELVVWGEPARCREQVARYARAGITAPVIALLPGDYDLKSVIQGLAPR
ncbi:MAG: LLM class F420-dependent oxidoreductase [Frankiaceae bacterium]